MNLWSRSFCNPISSAIPHKSLMVMESKYSLSLLPASVHISWVTHAPDFLHDFFEFLGGDPQATRESPPSVIRMISPTVISSGFFFKKYPPEGPRLLPMTPAFLS